MSWNTCKQPECESYTARPDGDWCESCRRKNAKESENEKKTAEKRATQIERQKESRKKPTLNINVDATQPIYKLARTQKAIRKLSKKGEQLNKEYKILADEFKRANPECVVRVNEYCTGKTESVHHKRGRGRYLLDISTFLPCCLSCHSYIEAHPKEAKEKGWSMSRLQTTEPHKI